MSQRASFISVFVFLFLIHLIIGFMLAPANSTYELAGSLISLTDHLETIVLAMALPALVLGMYKLFVSENVQDHTVKISILGCCSLLSMVFLYFVLK